MAKIKHCIHAEIDVSQPVPELCGVIANVLKCWGGKEKEVLTMLQQEIQSHLDLIEKKEEGEAE